MSHYGNQYPIISNYPQYQSPIKQQNAFGQLFHQSKPELHQHLNNQGSFNSPYPSDPRQFENKNTSNNSYYTIAHIKANNNLGVGKFQPNPNMQYKFTSELNINMCLDVSQTDINSKVTKNSLILYTGHYDLNQRFYIRLEPNGRYSITSALTGNNLQIEDGSIAKGARIIAVRKNDALNAKWQFVPVNQQNGNNNKFYIRTFCGKTVDINQQNAIDCQQVFQYDYTGKNNQIFTVDPA